MYANTGTQEPHVSLTTGTQSVNWGPVNPLLRNVPKKAKLLEALGCFGRNLLPVSSANAPRHRPCTFTRGQASM